MQLSSSWEASSHSSSQNIPRLFWKLKFHYRVHKDLPLVPNLSQINPAHNFRVYFRKIYFNIPTYAYVLLLIYDTPF